MNRPLGIRIAAALMCLSLVTETVLSFRHPGGSWSMTLDNSLGLGFQLIAAVFVWFFWQGHGWARWLVMLQSLLCLFELHKLQHQWHKSHIGGIVVVHDALLACFLLVYLNLPRVRAWFRACDQARAAAERARAIFPGPQYRR